MSNPFSRLPSEMRAARERALREKQEQKESRTEHHRQRLEARRAALEPHYSTVESTLQQLGEAIWPKRDHITVRFYDLPGAPSWCLGYVTENEDHVSSFNVYVSVRLLDSLRGRPVRYFCYVATPFPGKGVECGASREELEEALRYLLLWSTAAQP